MVWNTVTKRKRGAEDSERGLVVPKGQADIAGGLATSPGRRTPGLAPTATPGLQLCVEQPRGRDCHPENSSPYCLRILDLCFQITSDTHPLASSSFS